MKVAAPVSGVELRAAAGPRADEILSPPALAFLAELHRRFDARRLELSPGAPSGRSVRRRRAAGLPARNAAIREGDWKVAPIPADLLDRRVEITGPVDRKMIINALNSGAKVFMADFEDASSPAVRQHDRGPGQSERPLGGRARLHRSGDRQALCAQAKDRGADGAPARLAPRRAHLLVDGEEMSGSLFDFGLYVFHSAKAQLAAGSTPAFYLPKIESHLEARLWNDVFAFAETAIGVANGTLKATVLIETLPAAFEMDEILYELRGPHRRPQLRPLGLHLLVHQAARQEPRFLTPDRAAMTMGKAFLNAYSLLLIKTCHRRGAFAMGGMAAQIPIKGDPAANEAAFAKVRADKEREAGNGHDGTWVAHPDLVPVAHGGVRPADAGAEPARRHARQL